MVVLDNLLNFHAYRVPDRTTRQRLKWMVVEVVVVVVVVAVRADQ